jgi:hypothetical protein
VFREALGRKAVEPDRAAVFARVICRL